MDFLRELQAFLAVCGYGRMEYPDKLLYVKEVEENKLALLEVLPEPLRGQQVKPFSRLEEELQKLANQLMLRYNKQVDHLMLAVFAGSPSVAVREELAPYDDIWCINYVEGQVFIYENQKADYYNLKNALDSFLPSYLEHAVLEKKVERRQLLTPVNTGIIIINLLVFLALFLQGDVESSQYMAEHGAMTWSGIILNHEYYRLFTSMFMHFGWEHLLQNMFMLAVLGSRLERLLGKVRYAVVYFVSGLMGSLCSLAFTIANNPYTVSAGASGAIFGVMGGIVLLICKDLLEGKHHRIQEFGIVGILFMVISAVLMGFLTPGVDNMAHLGGLLGGFLVTLLISKDM